MSIQSRSGYFTSVRDTDVVRIVRILHIDNEAVWAIEGTDQAFAREIKHFDICSDSCDWCDRMEQAEQFDIGGEA